MSGDSRGAALVEAVLLCVILLIPVAWGLATLDQIHRAALASTAAVRDAGFEAARSPDLSTAEEAIQGAVAAALHSQDLDDENAEVTWSAPDGVARGSRIEIEVRYRVEVLGGWLPFVSVPVSARHALYVQPFGSRDA